MWLIRSSIGRKFVMAITGCCLVLFVTFHVLMNSVALIWPTAYNAVCEFLGANWYALVASAGLAALFVVHILYAVWLTLQNRAARGNDRYAVTSRPKSVEWSSKNMLVLGIVILAFLAVHMIQFWAKMQLQELRSHELTVLPALNGAPCPPAMGTLFIQMAFKEIWTPIIYIIGFVALWFHMNHGFWSMFQTVGWNGRRWLDRLKTISKWWTTIVVLLFVAQAIVFTILSHKDYYTNNAELQDQYGRYWGERAEQMTDEFNRKAQEAWAKIDANDMAAAQQVQQQFLLEEGTKFVKQADMIDSIMVNQCPLASSVKIQQFQDFARQIRQAVSYVEMQQQQMQLSSQAQQNEGQADAGEEESLQEEQISEANQSENQLNN